MLVMIVAAMVIPPSIVTFGLTRTMALLMTRNVFIVVPAIADKIDPLIAGIVGGTVPTPVPGMPRRNMHVDRRAPGWPAPDHAWL